MRLDLLVASANAGVLVYSGRLLAPSARLRPEDIVAYRSSEPVFAGAVSFGGGMLPWPVFPERDIALKIREVLDSKVGFDFLVYGTIGSVLTVIAANFPFVLIVPPAVDAASALAAGALAYGASWWVTERSGWYRKRERRLLARCFLEWLEIHVGDPKAKHQDFGLTVVSTARKSGFTLMKGHQPPLGAALTEADDKATARRVVAIAREQGYRWRRDDFRKWADEVSKGG